MCQSNSFTLHAVHNTKSIYSVKIPLSLTVHLFNRLIALRLCSHCWHIATMLHYTNTTFMYRFCYNRWLKYIRTVCNAVLLSCHFCTVFCLLASSDVLPFGRNTPNRLCTDFMAFWVLFGFNRFLLLRYLLSNFILMSCGRLTAGCKNIT